MDVCLQNGAKVVSSRRVAFSSALRQSRCFELLLMLQKHCADLDVRFTNDDWSGCISRLVVL